VVLHIHCVRTIAAAVLQDAPARLGAALAGMQWAWVRYAKPGIELARAVTQALHGNPGASILILQNHGLVAGGASVAEAEASLAAVRQRLAAITRTPEPLAPVAGPAPVGAMTRPRFPESHGIACDPRALRVARGGSLYPDHVVFLGRGIAVADDPAPLAHQPQPPPLVAVPGQGVLVRGNLNAAGQEMVRALALVTRHVPDGPIRFLAAREEDEILMSDAERYRQDLNAQDRNAKSP
jgi:hypothetical protein